MIAVQQSASDKVRMRNGGDKNFPHLRHGHKASRYDPVLSFRIPTLMMHLILAHIGASWLAALYLPAEHRYLDTPLAFASPLAALAYVTHWQQQGATVRTASQGAYAALQAEAAQGAGVVSV